MPPDDPSVKAARRVITPQQPLGPPDAAEITANTDLLRLLYDPSNRIHRQSVSSGAPFVIGRKGSGKTAFVTAPKLLDGVTAIELPSADLYQGVFDAVSRLLQRDVRVYPEHTSTVWGHLVWTAVLTELARQLRPENDGERSIVDFASALGDGEIPTTADAAVASYLRRLEVMTTSTEQIGGLNVLLSTLSGNGRTISSAIAAATSVIQDRDQRFVVIVDSLEHYSGDVGTTALRPAERLSFQGLFRFVGGYGNRGDRAFDIRFAFPAEMWPALESVSANPVKDFHQRVIAHWSARELIILVGTRLALYCQLHDPDFAQRHLKSVRVRSGSPLSYEQARTVLSAVLPPTVTNALGTTEDTVAYLLRHTQLLPRHIITILNRVWEVHRREDPDSPLPVAPRSVVEGVRHGEAENVRDILASFSKVHPLAELCCRRTLSNLGLVVTTGDLHRQYNQGGIRKETGLEFRDFTLMLVEIGCLGRVVDERSTERYVVAEYVYTRTGSLNLGDDERLCVHPIFAEYFDSMHSTSRLNVLTPEERSRCRAVYPYGSDPDEAVDYRDRI